MDLETTRKWSEVAKNGFGILALLFAGVWTYLLFLRTDLPSLEYRAKTNSGLAWSGTRRPGECIAHFDVTHENSGKSAFDVSAYQLRAWVFETSKTDKDILKYVDLQEIQKAEPPLFNQRYTDGPFIRRYPPNTSFRHSFEWIVRREPDKKIFFRIDLFLRGEEHNSRWHTGSWENVCEGRAIVGIGPNKQSH